MLSFVIFVAVTNLFLGLLLGWMFHGFGPCNTAANGVAALEQDGAKSIRVTTAADNKAVAVTQRVRKGEAFESHPVAIESLPRVEKRLRNPLSADELTPVDVSDSRRQLQQTKENIRYVRTIQDKGLAKEIVRSLRALVLNRQAQLQQYLNESLESESIESNAERPDPVALEMCLAQSESTISNLDAIDWKDQVNAILDGVERESELIEKSQLFE